VSREVEDLNRRLLRARDASFGNAIRILQPAKVARAVTA